LASNSSETKSSFWTYPHDKGVAGNMCCASTASAENKNVWKFR
jgi:hypothetical protein